MLRQAGEFGVTRLKVGPDAGFGRRPHPPGRPVFGAVPFAKCGCQYGRADAAQRMQRGDRDSTLLLPKPAVDFVQFLAAAHKIARLADRNVRDASRPVAARGDIASL